MLVTVILPERYGPLEGSYLGCLNKCQSTWSAPQAADVAALAA